MSVKFASTFVDDDCHNILPVFPVNVIGDAAVFKHRACEVGVIVPATAAGLTVTKIGVVVAGEHAPLLTVAI